MADSDSMELAKKIKGACASSGYEVITNDGTLGEGHFGKVYQATCKSDMCTYAIKVMPIDGVKMEKYHIRELLG